MSPTAWQPVRDMNSAKVGVAVSATVTVNVNADTQNVDGMKSAEVGAAVGVIQFGLCKYVTCESANSGNGLSGTYSIVVNSVTQVINADRVLDKVFTDTKTQEKPQFAVTKTTTGTYMVKTDTYMCVSECYKPSKAWFRDIFELIKDDLCAEAKNVVTSQSDSALVNRFTQAQRTNAISVLVNNTDSPWNHWHYNTAVAAIG